jgi:catechol 2,3-dioxygenase-like lactoylglutathione lyase family enzyme
VTTASFAVPQGALEFWIERFKEHQVKSQPINLRFGEQVVGFADPDGISLELVATTQLLGQITTSGPVSADNAIRGFHGVTISEEGYENTAKLLADLLGFRADGNEGNRFRYRAAAGDFASVLDLLCVPDARHGGMGAGVVHHIAFRTPDDEQQAAWRAKIARLGHNVSPVMDRRYFHSIYFREPGGVLFEIATDPPGFTLDEPPDHLGTRLMLPSQFERLRSELEKTLPQVRLPQWQRSMRHA